VTAPEVSPKTNGTTAAADPASFDPTNWAAEDTLWISVCGNGETSTTGTADTITGPPTNYTGQLIVARVTDAVGAVTGAVAFRQFNTSAEDVGTWAQGLAHSRNSALVIAVRPVFVAALPLPDVNMARYRT
jgi:hypothetical protein